MNRQSITEKPITFLRGLPLSLSYRRGLLIVLLVALLTHLPGPFSQLSSDDFMIRANVAGDEILFNRGVTMADPSLSFWQQISNGFHFFSPDSGTTDFYQQYGNLPWWSSEDAKMTPWRPISAATHWVDMRIAPDSFAFQASHTLVYILLMVTMAYRLYLRLSPPVSVAMLAGLFLAADIGHQISFSWIAARNVFIATALGCYALEQFLVWRQAHNAWAFVRSFIVFLAALLTAENSISLLAYFGAYLLLMERASLLRKAALLAPYLALVLVWRIIYNWLGFGADEIGLYQDPGNDLTGFLESLFVALPLILAGLITSVDGVLSALRPELWGWVSLGALFVVLLCLPLIRNLLQRSATARFILLGSVLAAVPACAQISAGVRGGVFASLGFYWLLAVWIHQLLFERPTGLRRVVAGSVLCLHLFLPALAGFLVTSTLFPVHYTGNGQFSSVSNSYAQSEVGPSLVVVNSPSTNNEYYLPFEWHFKYGVIPQSLNLLAPGLVTLDVKRLSLREFEVSAPMGLPLHNQHDVKSLNGSYPSMSSVFGAQMLRGLVTSPENRLKVGDRRYTGDMSITVLAMNEDRPSRLKIEWFENSLADDMVWQYYDWQQRQFKQMKPPAIGQTIRFPGPFDVDTSSPIRICLDCDEPEVPAATSRG